MTGANAIRNGAQTADPAVVALDGDLTIFEIGTVHSALLQRLAEQDRVTLDLAKVQRVDASALQLLVAAQRSGRVTVTGQSEALRARLEQLGAADARSA